MLGLGLRLRGLGFRAVSFAVASRTVCFIAWALSQDILRNLSVLGFRV